MELLDIVLLSVAILSLVVGVMSIVLALYTMHALRKFSNSTKWGLGRIKTLISEQTEQPKTKTVITQTKTVTKK